PTPPGWPAGMCPGTASRTSWSGPHPAFRPWCRSSTGPRGNCWPWSCRSGSGSPAGGSWPPGVWAGTGGRARRGAAATAGGRRGGWEPAVDFLAVDPDFRGGLRVALGDVNRDGIADLVVAPGPGGGPRVATYDGRSLRPGVTPVRLWNDFFAFEAGSRVGAFV